jgi:hypothetical protein
MAALPQFQNKLASALLKVSTVDYAKFLVGIGILLRAIQFLINQGLREDEGHLIINLINRNITDILKPLEHIQVAPPLFLLIEKINLIVFGQNEFAVRYFALVSSCLSLILFYNFLKTHTNIYITTIGVGLMAVNRHLIFYAVAAKQYSSDLLIHLLLFSILFSNEVIIKQNRFLLLGAIGVISIWLSHTSLFVLFTVSLYWLFSLRVMPRAERIKILSVWVCWGLSFVMLYSSTIANNPNQEPMANYWGDHFMPLLPHTVHQFAWFFYHFRDMISFSLGFSNKHYVLWIPFGISFLAGIVYSFKRKEYRFLLLLVTLMTHLVVSGFSKYPFYHRLILYQTFPLFFFIGSGIFFIVDYVAKVFDLKRIVEITTASVLITQLVITLTNFPYPTEDMKKDLAILKSNFKNGDKVYVYYPVDGVFDFYRGKYIPVGTPIFYGTESRSDFAKYEEEIRPLSGRVWFIFSHIYKNRKGLAEDRFIIDCAKKRGRVLLQDSSYSASVYLMHLN